MNQSLTDDLNSLRIVVWSDTHISKFTGSFNEEVFNRGVKKIVKILYKHPSTIVLHLGDVTDTGTLEDYIFAHQKIKDTFASEGIIPKIHYVPGNHDMRGVGYELWSDFFGKRNFFIDTTKKNGNVVILGIDSCEPDVNTGRIGDRGMEEVFTNLGSYPESVVKILCWHHHLIPIPNTGRERSTILDGGDIRDILWKAGIDIVINAHKHTPNIYRLSNGSRSILNINSGTFSSHKTRGRTGHMLLDISVEKKDEKLMDLDINFIGLDLISGYDPVRKFQAQLVGGEIPTQTIVTGGKPIVKICHFSDTHLTPGSNFQPSIFDIGMKMMLAERPDLILHSGNLTHDAYPEDYALAKEKIRRFREKLNQIPMILVPGRRDLHPLGKELWISQIGPLDPLYDNGLIRVWGINTGNESNGHVGRSRLKMLSRDIEEFKDKRIFIVLMHHGIIPVPKSIYRRGVKDAGDVLSVMVGKEVPFVLSGFEHHSATIRVENTVFVNAGTFSSKMIKSSHGNTFCVLTIDSTGLVKIEEIEIHSRFRHLIGRFQLKIPRKIRASDHIRSSVDN